MSLLTKTEKLVDALLVLADEATLYYKRENGKPVQLPLPTPAKPEGEKKAETKPAKTAEKKAEKTKPAPQDAADILADIEKPKPAAQYEKASADKPLTPEESLPLALTTAKEYAQRFQKSSPDGLTRLRKMLAEVYKVEKIGEMKHEARVEFIKKLQTEMAEAQ